MIAKTPSQLTEKIAEVCEELKRTLLWKMEVPNWVNQYQKNPETGVEFDEWLQFVYLPNLLKHNKTQSGIYKEHFVAPQAIQFFGEDVKRGKLLQLLVELDSLS